MSITKATERERLKQRDRETVEQRHRSGMVICGMVCLTLACLLAMFWRLGFCYLWL
jgi:hypothetical protein